jgi:putative beta-lysine N-acetyltransferase
MTDLIATYGKSKIQHGEHSDRAYLMSLSEEDLPGIVQHLDELATNSGYSKVFAKIPAAAKASFIEHGYVSEAAIPGFFRGEEQALFMGKYFCPERMTEKQPQTVARALQAALGKPQLDGEPPLPSNLKCRLTNPADAEQMAGLYRQVFATYPFPIHDAAYLQQTMLENVIYFGIWDGADLVALASAEIDQHDANAEMTDFATHPDHRGRGLANHLLTQVETAAAQQGIKTAYTIARAYSPGMNITFARNGYSFSGTLTHNTQISGTLESMNVWYKPLQP